MESFNKNVIKKHKIGLLNLATELGNTSNACRIVGFSRDTFYRYQTARDAGGVEALFEVSRKKPNLKNWVEEATELAVVDFAIACPAHGQVRANNELHKEGVFVSPSGVRSIWLRHDLASMKQRLHALELKNPPKRASCLPRPRRKLWSVKSTMTRPAAKSKPTILAISGVRPPFTSAHQRGWALLLKNTYIF